MTIEQIKKEVLYYRGKRATTAEAEEILACMQFSPGVSLSEIIADYYSC